MERFRLRSYTEIFAAPKANLIANLIKELGQFSDLGYRVYTFEVQCCLHAGLLLGGLCVSTALLELFIRDLNVANRIVLHHNGNMMFWGQVEREVEENRQLGFSKMLKELEPTVITQSDATKLREFYDGVRVPFAHGLVRRATGPVVGVDEIDDMFSDNARRSGLENRLEDGALKDINFVIETLKKYQPWLLRTQRGFSD